MVRIVTKIIAGLLNITTRVLIYLNKFFNRAVSTIEISNKLIYPYDMVISKEDYNKYILNKVPYVDTVVGKSMFGVVVGIDKHVRNQEGLLEPVTVKVSYLNLSNLSLPIVKTYNVEDLMFLISPVESFNRAANISNLLKDVDLSSLHGLEDDSMLRDEEGNDDEGGPIIH